MNAYELAVQDQNDAAKRERDRAFMQAAAWASAFFIIGVAIAAVYFFLAAMGVVPAAPWSPIGEVNA